MRGRALPGHVHQARVTHGAGLPFASTELVSSPSDFSSRLLLLVSLRKFVGPGR